MPVADTIPADIRVKAESTLQAVYECTTFEAAAALIAAAMQEQARWDAKIAYAHIERVDAPFKNPAGASNYAANTMAKKIAAAIRTGAGLDRQEPR